MPNLLFLIGLSNAGVAQLVEHLICNQRVGGSNPSASSTRSGRGVRPSESRHDSMEGLVSLRTSSFCVFAPTAPEDNTVLPDWHVVGVDILCGRVGEWLKPADCKSAAPCGLRRFESFPVHQDSVAEAPGSDVTGSADRRRKQQHRRIIADAMFESGRKRGGYAGEK